MEKNRNALLLTRCLTGWQRTTQPQHQQQHPVSFRIISSLHLQASLFYKASLYHIDWYPLAIQNMMNKIFMGLYGLAQQRNIDCYCCGIKNKLW